MNDSCVHRESLTVCFKELVDSALVHQNVRSQELTPYYVVQLLASYLRDRFEQEQRDLTPLIIRLRRALDSGGVQRQASLRDIADISLFVSGFFSDSLNRTLVDVDYYISIGSSAYSALSQVETEKFSSTFAELSRKFVAFVDVLAEVSERTSCSTNKDLLRLYEKWLKTRSKHAGQLLVERGLIPNSAVRSIRVQ
jgi:hypothetical protein